MVRGRNKSGQRRAIKAKQNAKRVPFTSAGLSKLPKGPGVYTINSNGRRSYIGSAKNIKQRVQTHRRNGNTGNSISFKRTVTRKQAYDMERKLIGKSCPSRNVTKPDRCKGFFEKNFGFRL